MPFITKQRLAELELKESQFEHLKHKYQEQQIELEILKRNNFSREKMINYRENMVVHEEPDTGRKVREFTTTSKTVVNTSDDPMVEEGRLSSRFHGFTSIVQEARTGY